MDLDLGPEIAQYRAELRDWIAAEAPGGLAELTAGQRRQRPERKRDHPHDGQPPRNRRPPQQADEHDDHRSHRGGDPAHNADVARRVLAGEPGPPRDLAAFNAGAAIYVSGQVDTLQDGVRAAEAALDSGAAAAALERLVGLTGALA